MCATCADATFMKEVQIFLQLAIVTDVFACVILQSILKCTCFNALESEH